jgi:hypothetical protein
MIWLKWIFSPIGRWTAALGAALSILFAAYLKGRREGKDAILIEQREANDRRVRDAVQADNAARRDIASGRLLNNDGHRRD